jgi:hypothetical protein
MIRSPLGDDWPTTGGCDELLLLSDGLVLLMLMSVENESAGRLLTWKSCVQLMAVSLRQADHWTVRGCPSVHLRALVMALGEG